MTYTVAVSSQSSDDNYQVDSIAVREVLLFQFWALLVLNIVNLLPLILILTQSWNVINTDNDSAGVTTTTPSGQASESGAKVGGGGPGDYARCSSEPDQAYQAQIRLNIYYM